MRTMANTTTHIQLIEPRLKITAPAKFFAQSSRKADQREDRKVDGDIRSDATS